MRKVLVIALLFLLVAPGLFAKDNGVKISPDMKLFMRYDIGLGAVNKANVLSVDRMYLGLKVKMDNVTFRGTTDLKFDGNYADAYVKYAYAEIKDLIPMAKLILGLQKTGLIDWEQKIWGHRDVAKVPVDAYGLDTSADYGVGVDMKVSVLHLNLTLLSGDGYKKAESGATQGKAFALRANVDMNGLIAGAYAKMWTKNANSTIAAAGVDSNLLVGGIVGYKTKMIHGAVEYFMNTEVNKGGVLSAYGTFNLLRGGEKMLGIFARFDMLDPDGSDNNVTTILGGAKYYLAKKSSLAAAFFTTSQEAGGDAEMGVSFVFQQGI